MFVPFFPLAVGGTLSEEPVGSEQSRERSRRETEGDRRVEGESSGKSEERRETEKFNSSCVPTIAIGAFI